MNPLPILGWLPKYQRRYVRGGLIAGISSWALVVPQSVAYGQIAGMPAQAGLSAAVTGPLGYGLLGTSRQLIVSPTSSSALISASVEGEMAGGASQSVANDRAGAQTRLASLILSALALFTAVALTFLFLDLPQAALGAIVISAIVGLFRVGDLRRIARLEREAFALALVALAGVLILGPLPGMILAIVLSVLILLSRTSGPSVSVLGRMPGAAVYDDLENHPQYAPVPGLLIIRLNGALFFANARRFRQNVLEIADRPSSPCKVVLLDLEMSPLLDIQSADILADTKAELARSGIDLWIGGVHAAARDMLQRTGYAEPAGEERVFSSVAQAVRAFERTATREEMAL